MKLEDLENNELVKSIVNNIIADETFKRKCKTYFNQIFEDGKIDTSDIPIMINLVLTVYNNHNKVKVTKEHLKPVFMLLISTLLIEFKGDIDIDLDLILLMLEPQIDILLMSIKMSNCKWPCCGSKPVETEDNMNRNMRLHKMERVKKIQDDVNKLLSEEVLPKVDNEPKVDNTE